MYIKEINNEAIPYSLEQFRKDNSQIAYGENIQDEILSEQNVYKVVETDMPVYDDSTQSLSDNIEKIEGIWTRVWTVSDITADEVLQNKLNIINTEYEAQIAQLTAGVPNSERESWLKQEQEARAYLADNTYPTPFIDQLVQNRGVPKDYLVSKIVEKANSYAQTVGALTGQRQAKEDTL